MKAIFYRSIGLCALLVAPLYLPAGELAGHKRLVTSVRTGDTEAFVADPVTGDLVNASRSPDSKQLVQFVPVADANSLL